MGKAGKERKKRRLLNEAAGHSFSPLPSPPLATKRNHDQVDQAAELVADLVTSDDLAITIATLSKLEENPEALRGKAFRPLRVVLHRLAQATAAVNIANGNTLSGRISDALTDQRWNDAMVALAEMREKGVQPKLGALQRWVRDCDAVGSENGLDGDPEVLRVLDSILRTADPSMIPKADPSVVDDVVRRHPAWILKEALHEEQGDEPLEPVNYKDKFRVVCKEKGPERRTPNKHDFVLYTSLPGTIPPPPPSYPSVMRHNVPNVPGAFLLTDVLSRRQCRQIISATEAVGFTPDEPLVGAASEQSSVLAHNLFWLADPDILNIIMARCEPFLPPEIGGGKLAGLNARWRTYRYVPGAIYRPHIDGAWPGSGLDPVTGEYVYDLYGDRRSKLTFLIYLNDDFENGCTTFFLPSTKVGVMDAWPVRPREGSVLCFPHGEANGALLHEGSAVTRGKKYIIRADVLYMQEKK